VTTIDASSSSHPASRVPVSWVRRNHRSTARADHVLRLEAAFLLLAERAGGAMAPGEKRERRDRGERDPRSSRPGQPAHA
jgi:hypothetical protein